MRSEPFKPESILLEQVRNFSCGSLARDLEIADFIKSEDGAVAHLQKGQVSLYFVDDDLVGFSSLGETSWRIPAPKGNRVALQIIPYLAVSHRHFRKGYARRILHDVVEKASINVNALPLLGLWVNTSNEAAISLYRSEGFVIFGEPKIDVDTNLENIRMLGKLPARL